MPIVYMATNRANGKRYIGITAGYLSQRKSKHFYVAEKTNSQTPIARAIRVHGREAFEFETISIVETYEDANREEIRLIAELKPEYNATPGGGGFLGYKPTPEAVEKIRAAALGRPGYWKGKKLPEHVTKLIVERNLQPHRRERWREVMKMGWAATKGSGRQPTDPPVRSIRQVILKERKRKQVICINDRKEFTSAETAAYYYGVSAVMVTCVCARGRHKSTRGLVFRYIDEFDPTEDASQILDGIQASRERTANIARTAKEAAYAAR